MPANPFALIRVVDNDDALQKTLTSLLSSEGWKVVGYHSAEEFLKKDDPLVPGCIVVEIYLPNMSGLQLQDELQNQKYSLPIIFLSASGEIGTAVSVLRKGAVDFLTKPANNKRLLESIESAVRKDWAIRTQAQSTFNATKLLQSLTARELEICQMVAEGLSNKAISRKLGIAEKTVKVHRSAIYRKLDVKTPLEIFKIMKAKES